MHGVQALYIHCLAHCIELVIKDVVSEAELLSDSSDIFQDLYTCLVPIQTQRATF